MVEQGDSAKGGPLQEAFDKLMSMVNREDQGWIPIFGASGNNAEQFGLDLGGLKQWSRKIRESVYGAPWIGAGHRLRYSYVWQNRIRYAGIPKAKQGKLNVQKVIDDTGNQFHFFSTEARRQRELCLYADGVAFWIGNDKTKSLEAIPLRQITDQLLEPTGLGYAIAYKREWSEVNLATGQAEPKKEWYFTDLWEGPRPDDVLERTPTGRRKKGDEHVPVSKTHTIFAQHANRGSGLVYGAPDALAAYVWNSIARDAYMDGVTMVRALAAFALKATGKSTKGTQNSSIALASTQTAGNTAVLGAANDLVPMSSAGKGYDFASLTAIVSIMATALGVSVIHLTADPGTAGSSYGSAATMDLPTRLAMEARREEHAAFDTRILRWMGVESPDVTFKPYEDGAEVYRSVQALALELSNDAITLQEFRDFVDDLHGRANGTAPNDAERNSVRLAKALEKVAPKQTASTASGTSTASPNQGRSNGTGGQSGAANDMRSDGVSD